MRMWNILVFLLVLSTPAVAQAVEVKIKPLSDADSYGYQCGFSTEGRRRYSGPGFGVLLPGNVGATVWLHPGQIRIDIQSKDEDGKFGVVESVDLRGSEPIQTADKGQLRVYKRFSPINWEQKLPDLISLLEKCSSEKYLSLPSLGYFIPKIQTKEVGRYSSSAD